MNTRSQTLAVSCKMKDLTPSLKSVIPLCDKVYVLDNQSYEKPFEKIATQSHSVLTLHSDEIAKWVQSLLADYL